MIHPERLRILADGPVRRGRFVLYWMQASQRVSCNHALEYATRQANELGLPVVVAFCIAPQYLGAGERDYAFMLEGLREVRDALAERGVLFAARTGDPAEALKPLMEQAALVVADRGYLKVQKDWRRRVAECAPCRVVMVETDVIVPVETASDHEEFAARTLRPKILRLRPKFLVPLKETRPRVSSLALLFDSVDLDDTVSIVSGLEIDRHVRHKPRFKGGSSKAAHLLDDFIARGLSRYETAGADPSAAGVSRLSPYLHFGQISPLEVALRVGKARRKPEADKEAFLEQLIVRRELSVNFVHYNEAYDKYKALPEWARRSLETHIRDRRDPDYLVGELDAADTHDAYWNAAMREMVLTGWMHNRMRMYWCKKIIEWTPDPRVAYARALHFNNRYFLDGRDPNSYAGVAWCFGKHDRPWGERDIFGVVRFMSADGLKRKFDMDAYLEHVLELERAEEAEK